MRLSKAHVRKYRSIIDSGTFEVEQAKTILVGPNEAGKTVLLQALQQLNPPPDTPGFDPLRDYPRSEYNDITTGKVDPKRLTIVEGYFSLDAEDQAALPTEFQQCETYVRGRRLSNEVWHQLEGGPQIPTLGTIQKDLTELCAHVDVRVPATAEGQPTPEKPSVVLARLTQAWQPTQRIEGPTAVTLRQWLEGLRPHLDVGNHLESDRHSALLDATSIAEKRAAALKTLGSRLPVFVLFNNYFRVRPLIHLAHLAERIEKNLLDDKLYDYGNQCLLKLLGFTARELSNLGSAVNPALGDAKALQTYRDQLDRRAYQLNAASVRLTREIGRVWRPDPKRPEAARLRVQADAQYLKVVVEDDLGVEIELDQRSEGFQWLVSFFVVFFAEASAKHQNAILLLDEPGLNLHGLKQRDFRTTISLLAEKNQTIYTTHSPFLVGPDELDLVRVVQMTDREVGTKVLTTVTSSDPASLLPLQEALGYDLAQSLFAQQRNLVLEGLTDYWYVDAVAHLLREAGEVDLNDKIALVPAGSAGKVVYYATILHAHELKVAALLDSDAAGDQAAQQDTLVHTLGNKRILRTKDYYSGTVTTPEVEDLLRDTLVAIAKNDLGVDVSAAAAAQPARPIVDILGQAPGFSKYKLAKLFLRWARDHEAKDLHGSERGEWKLLLDAVNRALK
jgi:predicted ATP-dependent endonuclease of OLD family